MVGHHVARLNGSVIPVNPPADHAAIVSLASVAGRPTACVAVGLVFATVWSGDVSKVTVGPSGAGGKVDATIALAADAVSNQLRFDAGVAGHFMVAVIVRGSEFGTAVLKTGQIVVLSVAKSFATYIAQHLGTHRS